jgi:hypothetical protein
VSTTSTTRSSSKNPPDVHPLLVRLCPVVDERGPCESAPVGKASPKPGVEILPEWVGVSMCARHSQRTRRLGDPTLARNPKRTDVDWPTILQHAATIVRGYDTGVTLRQLFYRLVSDQTLPNNLSAYNKLSVASAKARREGWFPDLIDTQRTIHLAELPPAQRTGWLG